MPTINLSTSANMIRPNFYTFVGAYILLVTLIVIAFLYYEELKAKIKPTAPADGDASHTADGKPRAHINFKR